jgi:putative membrane protein
MLAGLDPRSLVFIAIALVSAGPAIGILLPILAFIVIARILSWQAFRYGFDGAVVRVQQGVLQRQYRSIDVGRIQQVEIDQPLVHRMVGLAVLRIETASEGGQTEVELNGVSRSEAERLRAALRPHARVQPSDTTASDEASSDTPERRVLSVSMGQLALGAVTGAQLFALPIALLVLFEFAFDVGAEEDVGQTVYQWLQEAGLPVLLLLLAALALLAAIGAAIARDGGYRIDVRGDDVVIRRGLLTQRETVLPRHRVQVVEVRQNWVRRALGVATVHVRSAGGGAAGDSSRRIQVPLIHLGADLDRLLLAFLPDRPTGSEFRSHPPAALRRSIVHTTLRAVVVAGPLAVAARVLWQYPDMTLVTWQVPAVGAGLLLLAAPILGVARYRHLAHALIPDVVSSRHGALSVTVAHAPLRRLQGVTMGRSLFQRRLGLASLSGHLAGAGSTTAIVIHDAGEDRARILLDQLTSAAASRPVEISR